MAITSYTPAPYSDADFLAYTGYTFDDPKAYIVVNGKRIDTKYFLNPTQSMLLKLRNLAIAGAGGYKVRNNTGVSLAAGPVRIIGWDNTNTAFTIALADADTNTPAHLLLLSSLADATTGFGYFSGTVTAILDTSLAAVGDRVYLSAAGIFTLTAPTGSDQFQQVVGHVKTVSVTGDIQGIIKDPTKFGNSWFQGILPEANGGTGTSTVFTAGSIVFAASGNYAQDNTNLFWDNTAKSFILRGATGISLFITKDSTYSSETSAAISILSAGSDSELQFGADAANDISYIQSRVNGGSYTTRPLCLQPNGGFVVIGGVVSSGATFDVLGTVKITGLTNFNGYGFIRTDDANVFHFQAGSGGYTFYNNANSAALLSISNVGRVDIAETTNGTPLHFGISSADSGGYLISSSSSEAALAGGAAYENGSFQWRAKATTAAILRNTGGQFIVYCDTGLTAGNTFVPTLRGGFNTSGTFIAAYTVDISAAGSGQIKFPATQNASADLNTLDDYDEYAGAAAACTNNTANVGWKIVKIGNVVTLTLPITLGTTSVATNFSYGTAIPAKYRPAQNLSLPLNITENNIRLTQIGMVYIGSGAGVIQVFKSVDAAATFTNTANSGIQESASFSWVV